MKKDDLFDFDTLVERRGTASLKWEKYKGQDIIPLWVADMDFRSPPDVISALQQRVADGIFGYPVTPDELTEVVVDMLAAKFRWVIQPEWLVWLPGLVSGINVACRSVGDDGDDVMTAVPVYPPFLTAPGFSRRNLIKVALKEQNNRWTMNLDLLEESITANTRLFIFCNPHNPVGRVYTRREIRALADICQRHDIVVCSDEIHCDLILDAEKRHIPFATLDPEIAARTITLMAPSKTFNLPGLGCAFAVISEKKLRRRFKRTMAGIVPGVNLLGYTAALAAFRDCSAWQAALLEYLRGNLCAVEQTIGRMPTISMAPVEGTYLAWIDMRASGVKNPSDFFKAAGVGLQDGGEFAAHGFVRLNFGCPRSLLDEALDRMTSAMANV